MQHAGNLSNLLGDRAHPAVEQMLRLIQQAESEGGFNRFVQAGLCVQMHGSCAHYSRIRWACVACRSPMHVLPMPLCWPKYRMRSSRWGGEGGV